MIPENVIFNFYFIGSKTGTKRFDTVGIWSSDVVRRKNGGKLQKIAWSQNCFGGVCFLVIVIWKRFY